MITVSHFVPRCAGATSVKHGQRKIKNSNDITGLLITMSLISSGRDIRVDAPSGTTMLFGAAASTEGAVSQDASIERDAVTNWRSGGVLGVLPHAY